jgi:hypothetical protein
MEEAQFAVGNWPQRLVIVALVFTFLVLLLLRGRFRAWDPDSALTKVTLWTASLIVPLLALAVSAVLVLVLLNNRPSDWTYPAFSSLAAIGVFCSIVFFATFNPWMAPQGPRVIGRWILSLVGFGFSGFVFWVVSHTFEANIGADRIMHIYEFLDMIWNVPEAFYLAFVVLPFGMFCVLVSMVMNPLSASWLGWFQVDASAPDRPVSEAEPAASSRSFASRLVSIVLWPISLASGIAGLAALALAIWTGMDVYRGVNAFSQLYEDSRYSVLTGFVDGPALLLVAIGALILAVTLNPATARRMRIVGSTMRRVFMGFVAFMFVFAALLLSVNRNHLVGTIIPQLTGLDWKMDVMPSESARPTDTADAGSEGARAPEGQPSRDQDELRDLENEMIRQAVLDARDSRDCRNAGANAEAAVAGCTELIKRNPEDALPYYHRGTAFMILEQFDKARDDFSEAIRLDPTMARAFARRCLARFNRKSDYAVAVPDCNEAIRLAPKDYLGFFFRGILNLESGRYHEAIADFTITIQLDQPDNKFKVGYMERGDAYALIGSNDRARADWKIACEQGVKDACDVR